MATPQEQTERPDGEGWTYVEDVGDLAGIGQGSTTLPPVDTEVVLSVANLKVVFNQPLTESGSSTEDSRLKIVVTDLQNKTLHELTFSNLGQESISHIVGLMVDLQKKYQLDPGINDSKGSPVSLADFRALVIEATNNGGRAASELGANLQELSDEYQIILNQLERAATLRPKTGLRVRVSDSDKSSSLTEHKLAAQTDLEQFEFSAQPTKGVRWIDIEGPNQNILEKLSKVYNLDPSEIADCLHSEEACLLEERAGHYFIVINNFELAPGSRKKISTSEVHTFLGNGFIITVHDQPITAIEKVMSELSSAQRTSESKSPGSIFCQISSALLDRNRQSLHELHRQVSLVNDESLRGRLSDTVLNSNLPQLQRSLGTITRLLNSEKDIVNFLDEHPELFETGAGGEKHTAKVRRVSRRLDQSEDLTRALSESLKAVQTHNLSLLTDRNNRVVTRLTIISLLSIPTVAIGGLFGMNFEQLPFGSPAMMWSALGAMVLGTAGLAWYAWKNWWKSS